MKHGYYVMGVEDGIEFMYGKCETKYKAKQSYMFSMNDQKVPDEVKKTLKIVELVEKDITEEIIGVY